MAPRERGRPGFSRRAQYGIFTGYLAAALGALAGLGLLAIAVLDPASFGFVRAGATEVAAPAGRAGAASRAAGQGLFAQVGAYLRAGSQNAALRREVAAARVQQVRLRALADENRRLKALLHLTDPARPPVVTARLIGSTSASARRFAILGAGARDGVRPRMPVRAASGLVGRVLEVGPNTARVLLITDGENVVPLRRARDGVAAFSQGRADGRLVLRLIDLGVNPLRRGDVFVTSGSGGIYPPGIPVAVVERPTSDGAMARIVADPAAAEFVIVEPVFLPLPAPPASPSGAESRAP